MNMEITKNSKKITIGILISMHRINSEQCFNRLGSKFKEINIKIRTHKTF